MLLLVAAAASPTINRLSWVSRAAPPITRSERLASMIGPVSNGVALAIWNKSCTCFWASSAESPRLPNCSVVVSNMLFMPMPAATSLPAESWNACAAMPASSSAS
jgi:hypothetical protein